jgi:hypothetical protein
MTRTVLHPRPEDDPQRLAELRAQGLDADMNPLTSSPEERHAAADPGIPAAALEKSMSDPVLQPKTPVLQDKRLALAIATVISLLLASFLKVEIPAETIAGVVAVVLGFIATSATKEASVAKAVASQSQPAQPEQK